MEVTEATVKQIGKSIKLLGDGLCVRSDGETKFRTRISSEKVNQINGAY